MSALTALARGRDCQVRLIGICNFDPETTVAAHFRLAGTCGVGMKPPDLLCAWACSSCHSAIDGATRADIDYDGLRMAHAEGVFRTIAALIKLGKVKG